MFATAAAQKSLILPSVQHDSEAAVGEKRPTPDSTQELPGPSVGVLSLHMIEEETAGEDSDHAEETPTSPPCSAHQFSAEQYGMNTPAKAARGAGRRGPCVKVPQSFFTFVKHLKVPKLFGEILDKDAVEGRVLPIYICIFVCMYMNICAYKYAHMHTCTHAPTHARTYARTHTPIRTHMHTHTHTHTLTTHDTHLLLFSFILLPNHTGSRKVWQEIRVGC